MLGLLCLTFCCFIHCSWHHVMSVLLVFASLFIYSWFFLFLLSVLLKALFKHWFWKVLQINFVITIIFIYELLLEFFHYWDLETCNWTCSGFCFCFPQVQGDKFWVLNQVPGARLSRFVIICQPQQTQQHSISHRVTTLCKWMKTFSTLNQRLFNIPMTYI